MRSEKHQIIPNTDAYELLDSGEHEKLERFGTVTIARPDTQALWKKNNPTLWKRADATFLWKQGKGSWSVENNLPDPWKVLYRNMTLHARLTSFKHTGVFPEQAENWDWASRAVSALPDNPSVLNLFGYTGAMSIACARAGAKVTHVDASKTSVEWAKENATASELTGDAIRWVIEDVRAFVKREIRRGQKYDGILLDPPAFGRGTKDEVWKIEDDLLPLLFQLKELFSRVPNSFFLLNGYASGYSALSLAQSVESVFDTASIEYGELHLQEKNSDRTLPAGIFSRFTSA